MNIVGYSCLALLMLQGVGSLGDGASAQASSMEAFANYAAKGMRINRNILGWNIGKDRPTMVRAKGKKLGVHFKRFSEVDIHENPLGRICSYRGSTKNLSFLGVSISKIYLHFMDEHLMNVVLYPTKKSDIHVLKKCIERLYSTKNKMFLGEYWIEDARTLIRIHYPEDRRDRSFISIIDRDLADEMEVYQRFWRNVPWDDL